MRISNVFFLLMNLLLAVSLHAAHPAPCTLIIECPANITLMEGSKYDTSVTGYPKTVQSTGGSTSFNYIEIFQKGDCKNREDAVTRIFTVTNQIGEQQRCTQTIFLKHRGINDFYFPLDTTLVYPSNTSLTSNLINFKLDQGSVSISYLDTLVSPNCTGTLKIRRIWTVTDKCTNAVRKVSALMNIQGYGNSFIQKVSLLDGVCNSEGQIFLNPTGEFTPYNYIWTNGATGNQIYNLPAGVYQVDITDRFKCKQTLTYHIYNMSERADLGGRVSTSNGYRVIPDSVNFVNPEKINYYCFSKNGGLQYGMLVTKKEPALYNYRFRKLTDASAGVSTKDILLIQKQILNITPFKDTLLYFAADVNKSYTVTSSDIVEIRKVVLGIKTTFSLVDPWYFIRPDWKDVIKPYQTLESITFKGVDVSIYPKLNADAIALKLGDIDYSYRDIGFVNLETRAKTNEVYLEIGELNKQNLIPIYLHANKSIEGIQFSLESSDQLHMTEIIPTQLDDDAYFLTDQNHLNISWSNEKILHWDQQKPIFYIKINEKKFHPFDLHFGENLDAEIYNSTLDAETFNLQYTELNHKLETEKLIVYPNPAQNEIQFLLSKNSDLNCSIYDPLGRLIFKTSQNSSIQLNVSDWMKGVYYYDALIGSSEHKSGSFIISH